MYLFGLQSDKDFKEVIYFGITGGILVLGLLVTIFMVKERKVPRNYTLDQTGTVKRYP